ncbi:uncharacterized protein LOC134803390 isoform X1 [Cydia splendana]|uniref:uncharacterized protein LOC134803390 isoform X1 n=1 Tax=Cydia splendana TaxID=1100963 RepID=UPI0028F47F3A
MTMILFLLIYVPLVLSSLDVGVEDTDLKTNTCTSQEEFSLILSEIPKKNLRHNGPATTLRGRRRQRRAAILNQNEITKKKACTLMQQSLYASQELIRPLERLFKSFQAKPEYRVAYIFLQMEQAVADAKSIMKMIIERRRNEKNHPNPWSTSQRLQVFWQLVKRHTDLTYLLDYLRERIPLGTAGVDTTPGTPAPDVMNRTGKRSWWMRRPKG